MSPPGDRTISALAVAGEMTYVACGPHIYAWKRVELVQHMTGHTAEITHLLVFGGHLLSVANDNTLRMWDLTMGAHRVYRGRCVVLDIGVFCCQ